jgi:hypothetical protein
MPTRHIPIDRLARLRTDGLRKFYMRPGKIATTLAGASSPREMANLLKYGMIQLKDIVAGRFRPAPSGTTS